MIYRSLPEILKGIRASSPEIEIAVQEMNSAEQIEALHHDELDVGFIHVREMPPGLEGFRYDSEAFVACMPAGHSRAAASRAIDLRLLQEEEFVLFSRKLSPDYYESVIAVCLAAGFLPKIRYEARQWLSIVALVARGIGVALVPEALARSEMAGVQFRAIAATNIRSETWCVWRRDVDTQAIRESFLVEVRKQMRAA
jgi:DNA-binding transcriptional LysR family regulator